MVTTKSCSIDLAGLALDALSSQEEQAAKRRVTSCAACDRTYSEFQEVAAALASAVVQISPPEDLKCKVAERAAHRPRNCNSPESRIIVHAANTD